MDKYKKAEREVRKYLKDKDSYEAVDDTLITELIFNIELADMAKIDIRERGVMVNVRKEGEEPYMQINQSVGAYSTAVKQVTAISTKLGITVLNRTQLGLESKAEDDELDMIIKT